MKAHKAYGIAANQVTPGPLVRIIAVTTKEYVGAMFNPEILKKLGGIISEKETCLSLKGEYPVPRIQQIEVSFRNIAGEARTIVFEGLGAIVVQHEIDHLNGVLASDYFDSAPEIS
jgi:peptide deformylase